MSFMPFFPSRPHPPYLAQLSSSPTALKSAAAALVALLVDHSDNNVRLVTLDRLILLKQKHPLVLQGMVLDLCRVLQAPSPDIRSRSLALISELVTSSNVDNVLGSLKKELSSRGSDTLPADADFKASIVASLVVLTSNFPDTASTICNTLLDLITDAGSVAVDSMQGVRELIAVFPDIRPAATQRLRDVIGSVRQGRVLRILVACLAEFSVGSAALKASLDETFAMIGPLPLQVLDATDSKAALSHDRPKVLADGSYASQSSIGGGEGGSASGTRHPLVVSLLQGEYSVGVSIASSLSKLLVLYKSSGSSDQAEESRLCVNMILLCSSVMRLTKVDGSKGMDSDSVEKLCSIMFVVLFITVLSGSLKCFAGLSLPTTAATLFFSNGSPPARSCTPTSCK
jgi:coatomer subunit beta